MDFDRETDLINAFLASPFGPRHRFIHNKWWALDEKGWTQIAAKDRARRALITVTKDTFPEDYELHRQIGMVYMSNRVLGRLMSHILTNYLPGPGQELGSDLGRGTR